MSAVLHSRHEMHSRGVERHDRDAIQELARQCFAALRPDQTDGLAEAHVL